MSGAGTRTVRLLLVDDEPAVRRGLRIWLALEPNLEVVGEAGRAAEAMLLAQALRPDVILMDVEMPGMDGISATAALRSVAPQSAVVILTLYDDAATRARALRPDVILMDVEMPGMDGISATAALRSVVPQSAVVILTLYDDAATRTLAREAFAAALVAKHQMEETLLEEIRRVAVAHEKQRRHERPLEWHEGSEA